MQNKPSDNVIGSLWMVAAMAGFAIEDSFFKASVALLPIGQVLVLFGGMGALLFATYSRRQGHSLFVAEVRAPAMMWRAGFEVIGRLFFFLSLALTPLSTTTVILQATPIVVVAGAAAFLGESVGWRRWVAILMGFIGVLIVVLPGSEAVSIYAWLGVLGMLGFAGRDLASRVAPKSLPTSTLGFYGFLAVIVAGLLYQSWSGEPFKTASLRDLLPVAAAAAFGVLSYSALMKAMRTGDVATVTPFRYSRLFFGLLIGVLWFGERLAPHMLVGCALIILAGLFLMWRGRQRVL